MEWREVKFTGEIYEKAPEIWLYECSAPRWLRDSLMKRQTLQGLVEFIEMCDRVYGLYCGRALLAVVYVEKVGDSRAGVHFSVLDDVMNITGWLAQLRSLLLKSYSGIVCWVLRRNVSLVSIMDAIGLRKNGLQMDDGWSHGRPMTWDMMIIER